MGYTLRVSVLETCQLRCAYCLPHGANVFSSRKPRLSIEQYRKFALALKSFVVDKIRFTGGEPLLRPDLSAIIKVFKQVLDVPLALTTNGLRFLSTAADLKDAGLKSITFHLDTLKEERYRSLMGFGDVKTVLRSIDCAILEGFQVKLNTVVQKGLNDDELIDILRACKARGIEARFIEQMNTGSAQNHVQKTFMSGAEILARIGESSRLTSLARLQVSDPSERFFAEDLNIVFGMIASDTRPFCANCNRLRLSVDGRLRTCLYEPSGQDIGLLHGVGLDELVKKITAIVANKTSFHPSLIRMREKFSMAEIGG